MKNQWNRDQQRHEQKIQCRDWQTRNSALKPFMGISGSEHQKQSISLLSDRDTRAGNGGENEIKPNTRSNQFSVHLKERNRWQMEMCWRAKGKESWCNRITMWESKDFNSAFPSLPCFVFFFTPCFPSALRGSLSPSFTLGGRERWNVPEDKMTQRQSKHMKLAGTLQKLGDSKAGKLLLWQLRPGDWPQNSLWSVTWTVSSLFLSSDWNIWPSALPKSCTWQ